MRPASTCTSAACPPRVIARHRWQRTYPVRRLQLAPAAAADLWRLGDACRGNDPLTQSPGHIGELQHSMGWERLGHVLSVHDVGHHDLLPTAGSSHRPARRLGLRYRHTALAKLFSGTAQVELQEHFAAEAVLAGLVGSNAANLQDAIAGETYEHTTMYPGFATQATKDGCTDAAALFTEIAGDEGGHAAAYTVALQSLTNPKVKVPKPQTVDPVVITASTPACPGTPTQVNLLEAMHGEAFAYAKYTAYALQAARTHQTALAKLFSGTAQVELQEHFAGEAVLAGLVDTNTTNLLDSIT